MTSMGAVTFSKERTVRKGLVTRCQVQSQISSEILTALEKRPKTNKQTPTVTAVLPQCYCMYAKSDKATQEVFS